MPPGRPLCVLFDIDETLVHTGGSGARSWSVAFDTVYGIAADIGKHTSAGETDPQVTLATFRAVIGRDPEVDELAKLYRQYLFALATDIWESKDYRVLPGAEATLQALGEAGVTIGVVSGAMEGAARTKLLPGDLNRFFIFGSYGSDSPDRAELTKLAIDKAALLHDGLTSDRVFVVGDTPHDIDATKAAGAVAIGVASGHYSVDQLEAAGAAYVLESLEAPFPGI